MKNGDKVLIEGVLSGAPTSTGGWRVRIEGGDAEDPLQGWVSKSALRPWTEPPVTVLWTNPDGFKVMSDGEVHGPAGVPCSDEVTAYVLAAYVRHPWAK